MSNYAGQSSFNRRHDEVTDKESGRNASRNSGRSKSRPQLTGDPAIDQQFWTLSQILWEVASMMTATVVFVVQRSKRLASLKGQKVARALCPHL